MSASISKYNNFAAAISDITLRSATIKVTLHTSSYTFAATHSVYADLTNELATANGYTNGGLTATPSWGQSGGVATFDLADAIWTASGGSITARRAVVRAVGTFNSQVDPLIASVLLDTTPADVTATAGTQLKIQWNASGVFTLT